MTVWPTLPAARFPVGLRLLPDTIQVGPWRCTVVVDLAAITAACADHKMDLDGQFDSRNLTITVRPDLPPDMEAETVTHELLHALTAMTGINSDLDADAEEALVTRLSPALLDTLRRNPDLTRYLLGV